MSLRLNLAITGQSPKARAGKYADKALEVAFAKNNYPVEIVIQVAGLYSIFFHLCNFMLFSSRENAAQWVFPVSSSRRMVIKLIFPRLAVPRSDQPLQEPPPAGWGAHVKKGAMAWQAESCSGASSWELTWFVTRI